MRALLFTVIFVFTVTLGFVQYVKFDSKKENRPVIDHSTKQETLIDTLGKILKTRFKCPENFNRVTADDLSFANYLRNLPLKNAGERVRYYDRTQKPNAGVYLAVVDKNIGTKNLHQCADAVMRLRAEYLWEQKRFSEIKFNFTNGFVCDYDSWRKGKRVRVNGNSVKWVQGGLASDSYEVFWSYLEMVFTYAGTLSLSKELKAVNLKDMAIGDVFIRGGSPGHAVIIVDMAKDSSGNSVFMLAQSYMPAQEIQILTNPLSEKLSPWYSVQNNANLRTPEWVFEWNELKAF